MAQIQRGERRRAVCTLMFCFAAALGPRIGRAIERPAGLPTTEGWDMIDDEDGVQAFRRKGPDSKLYAIRGEGVIDATLEKVASIVERRAKIMPSGRGAPEAGEAIIERRIIKTYSDIEETFYQRIKTPFPLDDRDFVIHSVLEAMPSEKILIKKMDSIETPDAPERSCCVRGEVKNSEMWLKSIDNDTKTYVIGIYFIDPKGAVPSWAVNFYQKNWPYKSIRNLRTIVADPGLVGDPYFSELVGLKKR